jgi:hypothetical protein
MECVLDPLQDDREFVRMKLLQTVLGWPFIRLHLKDLTIALIIASVLGLWIVMPPPEMCGIQRHLPFSPDFGGDSLGFLESLFLLFSLGDVEIGDHGPVDGSPVIANGLSVQHDPAPGTVGRQDLDFQVLDRDPS